MGKGWTRADGFLVFLDLAPVWIPLVGGASAGVPAPVLVIVGAVFVFVLRLFASWPGCVVCGNQTVRTLHLGGYRRVGDLLRYYMGRPADYCSDPCQLKHELEMLPRVPGDNEILLDATYGQEERDAEAEALEMGIDLPPAR